MNILAIIAGIILAFAAFGAHLDHVNLVWLGLAFWALSFGVPFVVAMPGRRVE